MMRAYIGASESGKSTTAEVHAWKAIAVGWTVAVLDLVQEWPRDYVRPKGVKYTVTSDTAKAMSTIVAGRPMTVLRPPEDVRADPELVSRELERLAIACRKRPEGVVLVVPEAQVSLKEHRNLDTNVNEVIHRFRHNDVTTCLWLDTQMIADVSKEALGACREWYCFGGAQVRDGGRIKRMGKRPLVEAIEECGRRAVRQQEPGWHVMVQPLDPTPPFPLRRETLEGHTPKLQTAL